MKPTGSGIAIVTMIAVTTGILLSLRTPAQAIADGQPEPKVAAPTLDGSAIKAVLEANGGKPPTTGEQLWKMLNKLGKFAQLPVVFSAVRLDSGLGNPRVVITPLIGGLSEADATAPNLNGRLFLAANMEKDPKGGDPRVTSVEFISWNSLRRKFDFGVIDNMGETSDPQFQIVDGGRCFSCHKNRGPILGASPWLNTTHFLGHRMLVADKLKLVDVLPAGAPAGKRDRIDGMALAAPEAAAVDGAVRLGSLIRLNRETFQLMNRSESGRKGFVAMLVAITEPVLLDANQREAKRIVENWGNEQSYINFAADWVALAKSTNSGILNDFAPFPRATLNAWGAKSIHPIPTPPPGGFTRASDATQFDAKVNAIRTNNDAIIKTIARQVDLIAAYDTARAEGKHGMPSHAQPSNPKAFMAPAPKATQKPSAMVNPVMLANTLGLTEGDRHFLARSLAEAAEKVSKPKVTANSLAQAVFEGPEFADILAGGPLPDRDDFKDRFVVGLDKLLTTKYAGTKGFTPERRDYASGPRFDPKLADEKEVAVVPTTSCLRCHDVRTAGKPRMFESIPALAFDPFDKTSRSDWLKVADKERTHKVLSRMLERLYTDADMPPQDSPEYDRFRLKEAAAFDEVKEFLHSELDKIKKP